MFKRKYVLSKVEEEVVCLPSPLRAYPCLHAEGSLLLGFQGAHVTGIKHPWYHIGFLEHHQE